ncbi:endonuclease I [Streptomyces sp. SLBN-118]|uniref:endonuclease n=1 Tax=Streptomyces sp. SLBN-118 TaxID=2768454 RepID=UPI001153A7B5|nr:endonuclease [Streptomyces sp. SLBN-118]TQK50390.1 endonuclease I [Streptomyces sp. SLBN-118]
MTVQQLSHAETEYLSQIKQAHERYEMRAAERARNLRVLDRRGILHTDAPERVEKRLARLGADLALATAIEQTPTAATTGSSLELAPDSFGADVLGLERLMGRNDLIEVGFLETGFIAARSIGRVTVRAGGGGHHGTGFLISPTLLMTNNHVLRTADEASNGVIEFNFQAGLDGQPLLPVVFRLEPQTFFVTDRDLDFSVVAVAQRSQDGQPLTPFGRLPLREAEGKVILGEVVNIIQHPNGEPKQLALRENTVVDLLEKFVHYETDTAPGSSGSPVFNDQWEVVALHHAGVPRTDEHGRPLAVDGSVWEPSMGEHRLDWKANEGVRISRVLGALRQVPMSGPAAALREEIFAAGAALHPVEVSPPPGRTNGVGPQSLAGPVANGTAQQPVPAGPVRLSVPLNITISVDPATFQTQAATTAAAPAPAPVPATALAGLPGLPGLPGIAVGHIDGQSPADNDLAAARVNLAAARTRPYYDAAADRIARDAYYADIRTGSPTGLRRALAELLEATHEHRPAYKPMRMLYPWVDLHPDEQLRSIYSGKDFTPEELIEADAAVEAARIGRWQEFLLHESAPGPGALEAEFDALEAALPFNCEHVVPQSWFAKKEPMRGDLHHLFACESACNSFRGNIPYFDFADSEEVVRHSCGRREPLKFEPSAGKGPVARATLYFLLRYPGFIGDEGRELQRERLDLLLSWHAADAVSEYERHRNAATAEIQGNRNPLIDHPEWAEEIDFAGAWPDGG